MRLAQIQQYLVQLDQQARKVFKVQQELPVLHQQYLAQLVHKVFKDLQDLKVRKVFKVQLVLLVRKVFKV